jgi:hypothetical protein
MRYIYLLFLIVTFLSCKETIKNEKKVEKLAVNNETVLKFEEPSVSENLIMLSKDDLLGYWVGNFDSDLSDIEEEHLIEEDNNIHFSLNKKITISIDEINDSIVKGHSIVSGNIRPFEGVLDTNEKGFYFNLEEPGDNKFDGKFTIAIRNKDSLMIGKWQSNEVLKIDRRTLKLKKKLFVYNPENELQDVFTDWDVFRKVEMSETLDDKEEKWFEEEYLTSTEKILKINASKDLLTKEFVENLQKSDIFILRNSIYARHGYSFKNRQLRSYFEMHDWYMPVFNDVSKDFTELELENIDMLLLYEENAEEYYDRFGR